MRTRNFTMNGVNNTPYLQRRPYRPGVITGDIYKATPILLNTIAFVVFLLIAVGLITLQVSNLRLMVNITLTGIALFASLTPTSILFMSHANEVDALTAILRLSHPCHLQKYATVSGENKSHRPKHHFSTNQLFSGVPTLLFCLYFLLLLSGDVELNPGPRVTLTVETLQQKLCESGFEENDPKTLKYFGAWLNTPPGDRTSLQRVLTYFIENHPFGSWRTVIWALDAIDKQSVAENLRILAESIEDSQFSVRNVTDVIIKTTQDWYGGFADSMAIPWTIQEGIKQKFSTIEEQKRAIAAYWVNTLHDACWETLGGVLHQWGEVAALKAAKKFFKKKQDDTLTLTNLMRVLSDIEDLDCESFAYYLDVPSATRAQFGREHKNDQLLVRLRALMEMWLKTHPAPTWRLVANALSWMGRKNKGLHEALRTIYKPENSFIPDPESKRLCRVLNRAQREGGMLQQSIVQLHLSGTARSGKTSLIRRLMGKKAREFEPSTGVADKPLRIDIVRSSVLVDESVWREVNDIGDESVLILNEIRNEMARTDEYEIVPEIVSVEESEHRTVTLGLQPEPHSLPSMVNPTHIFGQAIERAQIEVRQLKDPVSIYITDIGGQHEFQELVPALVSGPSVFLIVIPAHWGLNKTFPVEFLGQDGSRCNSYQAGFTLKEYILQTLATIMYIKNRHKTAPKLIFVLTFKDKVSADKLKELDTELKEAVKSTSFYDENMIAFAEQDKLCHTINNLSEDNSDIENIRQAIEGIAKKNEAYHISTPYSWQFFGISLRSLGASTVDYNTCLEIGTRCGISSRQDLDAALDHFHHQTGVIRYYQSVPELQDLIFLNPQVIFDCVSELITSTFTFDNVGAYESELFSKKGIFSVETLAKVMPLSSFFTTAKLIAFLQQHHIIAPLRGRDSTFILPCKLSHSANLPIVSDTCSVVPPLAIAFKSGFAPRGLFGLMVSFLIEADFVKQIASDEIFQNKVTVCVEPYLDRVSLSLSANYIRIDVVPSTSVAHAFPIGQTCCRVKDLILRILDEIADTYYNINTTKYNLAFLYHCPTLHELRPAVISVIRDTNQPAAIICGNEARDLPKDHHLWFDEGKDKGDMLPSFAELESLRAKNGEKIYIIRTVAPKWKCIGALMDFDHAGSHLEVIKKSFGNSNPVSCCSEVFRHWLLGNGKGPFTWRKVTEYLVDSGYPSIAQQVKTSVGFE